MIQADSSNTRQNKEKYETSTTEGGDNNDDEKKKKDLTGDETDNEKSKEEEDERVILGVSVFHLRNVFLESKVCGGEESTTATSTSDSSSGGGDAEFSSSTTTTGLSRDSKIHEIENLEGSPGIIRQYTQRKICPIDGRNGSSYAHCLEGRDHVGIATHMLSYSWSYKIGDIVDTLEDFCYTHNLPPKETYIWIDCLFINQHRVVEQKENGGTGMLNFEEEFPLILQQIGHLLAMMHPWQNPVYLTRLWCVFEMYAAHAKGCKIDIVMPPREKESLEHDVIKNGGGIDALYPCSLMSVTGDTKELIVPLAEPSKIYEFRRRNQRKLSITNSKTSFFQIWLLPPLNCTLVVQCGQPHYYSITIEQQTTNSKQQAAMR